ncbi:LysM peptidoglycan-binding domain-containing protein [Saccharopolyspora sp. SCSIO 74807]|uniref:LysM peptidoglycan-binding domain-containing protein n=1 Tax=Saccharopolyspora sp. SCSIO 74807 TaxID=3118084 RepID=UPI0030CE9531
MIAAYHEIRLQLPTDEIIVLIGLIVLWSLWAVLICCLLADTLAVVRYGAHRLRIHRPRGLRGWITAVVTTTALAGTAAPSLASTPPTENTTSAPREPDQPQHDSPTSTPAAGATTDEDRDPDPSLLGPAAYVHRGDSLWTLAAAHLGDGTRWREIAELNPHLTPHPQVLRAGQWLHMPTDADHLHPPHLPTPTRWITVTPGDTLAGLAEHHLGDPERWQEIYALNRGRTQSTPSHTALHNPDTLMPGWRLALPPTPAPLAEPSQQTPAEPPPRPEHIPSTPAPDPEPHAESPTPGIEAPPIRGEAGIVLGLAAAGSLAAAYRWRRRRVPHPPTSTLPAVYSLPVAPDHRDEELPPEAPANGPAFLSAPARSHVGEAGDDNAAIRPRADSEPPTPTEHGDAVVGTEEHAEQPSTAEERIHGPRPACGGQDFPTEASLQGTSVAHNDELPVTSTEDSEHEPAETTTAADALARTPAPPAQLTVFGPPTLTWQRPDGTEQDFTSALAPKHRALLLFLALHPTGTYREAVREALWPDARGNRRYNSYYATVSQLHKRLAAATGEPVSDLVRHDDEHVALNPDLVAVDYWEFLSAERDQRRADTERQRLAAWERIVRTYRGELAAGHSALWLDGPREAAHRTAVDALSGMAAAHRQHPERRLPLLEHARSLDPHNENLYRDIMRTQAELGLTDAISRTVELLTTTLADIGERPHPNTLMLARSLQAEFRQS